MSTYFYLIMITGILFCLIAMISDAFWSLWDECEDDEISDLEQYRSSDDTD